MKGLTVLTVFMVLIWHMQASIAGEVTGAGAAKLLAQSNYNAHDLQSSGHKILYGELTGAGRKMHLDRVKLIMTNTNVFVLDMVTHIEFKNPSKAKSLLDVNILEFDQRKIEASQIKAMVVK